MVMPLVVLAMIGEVVTEMVWIACESTDCSVRMCNWILPDSDKTEGWIVMVLRLVGTLGLTLSVLMTIIVPVPHLPGLPSGSFKVGTIVDCWTYVAASC